MSSSRGYLGNNGVRKQVWWCGENTDHRQANSKFIRWGMRHKRALTQMEKSGRSQDRPKANGLRKQVWWCGENTDHRQTRSLPVQLSAGTRYKRAPTQRQHSDRPKAKQIIASYQLIICLLIGLRSFKNYCSFFLSSFFAGTAALTLKPRVFLMFSISDFSFSNSEVDD